MAGFMADFDADLARPFGVAAVGSGSLPITSVVGNVVSGTSPPNAGVALFSNGIAIGFGNANASGQWSIAPQYSGSGGLSAVLAASASLTATLTSTWNPLDKCAPQTLSNGNNTLTHTNAGVAGYNMARAWKPRSSGKWYFEVTNGPSFYATNGETIGVAQATETQTNQLGSTSLSVGLRPDGYYCLNNSYSNRGWSYNTAGSVVCVAVDFDNRYIYFGKNGVWYGSENPSAGTGGDAGAIASATNYYPACSTYGSGDAFTLNTGSSPFVGAVPTGFLPWG